jgi:hypothetical protein
VGLPRGGRRPLHRVRLPSASTTRSLSGSLVVYQTTFFHDPLPVRVVVVVGCWYGDARGHTSQGGPSAFGPLLFQVPLLVGASREVQDPLERPPLPSPGGRSLVVDRKLDGWTMVPSGDRRKVVG